MSDHIVAAEGTKRIALVAHDEKKSVLLDWAHINRSRLVEHRLSATGSTGRLLEQRLGLAIHCFRSGPLGGDHQIGARIADGEIDALIFFWDPLASHPHEADVRALLRIAVLSNIPIACNEATADSLITSTFLTGLNMLR